MSNEKLIENLLATEQIRQQMATYARGIDRRDEALLKQAYHEDSFDDHGYGLQASGWIFATLVRPDGLGFPTEWTQTGHFLGQHLIEVDGDKAVSEVYFNSVQISEHDGKQIFLYSAGRYLDEWERREDGVFRIAKRQVIYDYGRTDEVSTPWPGPDHEVPKMFWGGPPIDGSATAFGKNGPEDPSYRLFPQQ
jgi:SnoaL-like domain